MGSKNRNYKLIMNSTNTNIILSTYKRSTQWADRLSDLGYDVYRYTKEDPTSIYNVEKNIGREASAFLKYILDFYESLPEYTIFLHDEEFAWHHEGSIIDRITEKEGFVGNYSSLNNHPLPYFYLKYDIYNSNFYNTFLEKYLGPLWKYGEFMGPERIGSAQMIVSRSAILAHPYEMYEKLYFWMISITEERMKYQCGIFMEFFWELIFGGVEPLPEDAPRILIIGGTASVVAHYANHFIDMIPTRPIEEYDLYLFQDESVKNVNYDFLYTILLGLPYRDPGFTLQFENDDRFILTASLEESGRTAKIILEQKLEEAEILGYGFEDQVDAARC
jgi:hypothetical protein